MKIFDKCFVYVHVTKINTFEHFRRMCVCMQMLRALHAPIQTHIMIYPQLRKFASRYILLGSHHTLTIHIHICKDIYHAYNFIFAICVFVCKTYLVLFEIDIYMQSNKICSLTVPRTFLLFLYFFIDVV